MGVSLGTIPSPGLSLSPAYLLPVMMSAPSAPGAKMTNFLQVQERGLEAMTDPSRSVSPGKLWASGHSDAHMPGARAQHMMLTAAWQAPW